MPDHTVYHTTHKNYRKGKGVAIAIRSKLLKITMSHTPYITSIN